MKIKKSLLFVSIIVTMLPITAKAEAGDFYYGDSAANLQRVKKADVKSNVSLLKQNYNNLYFQINNSVIVKYKDFMSGVITSWSSGSSITDSYVKSVSDTNVQAPADIKSKASEIDTTSPSTDDDFDVSDIY